MNALHLTNADGSTRAVAYILAVLLVIAAIEGFTAVVLIRAKRQSTKTTPVEPLIETRIKEVA